MAMSKIPVQWLGTALVPIAAAVIGWYGVYQPQRDQRLAAQAAYAEEQQKTVLQRDIADRETLVHAYQNRLPKTADTDWLISQSAAVAAAAGIQLHTVRPDSPVAEKGYTRLTITVESVATYHELGRFVSQLESAQSFICVDRVKVAEAAPAGDERSSTDGAPTGRRKIMLTLSTIYLP